MLDALGTRRGGTGTDAESFLSAWSSVFESAKKVPEQHDWVQSFVFVLGLALTSAGGWTVGGPVLGVAANLGPVPAGRRVVGLSDTLLVTAWGPESPEKYLPTVASYLRAIFGTALEGGLLLRGVISIGEWVEFDPPSPDNVLLVGDAIDDAAEWYDKADWMGVALTPRAGFGWESTHPNSTRSNPIVEYPVPLKDRELERDHPLRFALNWPGTSRQQVANLLDRFSRKPIPAEATRKYHETAKFFSKFTQSSDTEASESTSSTSIE